MRKTILFAAAIAAAATPAMTLAADEKADDAKVEPGNTPEDIQRGALIIRLFNEALNSDKVTGPQKGAMIRCLYNNPVRKISVATGETFANNKQLDAKNPNHIYQVAAAVCGVPKEAAADGKSDPSKGR